MDIKKKGQAGTFFMFMIAVTMFILGFQIASTLITNNIQVMNNMDCFNASISTHQKITCTVLDVSVPFVVGVIFALGGLAFGSKVIS